LHVITSSLTGIHIASDAPIHVFAKRMALLVIIRFVAPAGGPALVARIAPLLPSLLEGLTTIFSFGPSLCLLARRRQSIACSNTASWS